MMMMMMAHTFFLSKYEVQLRSSIFTLLFYFFLYILTHTTMVGGSEQQAKDLIAQAQKKLNSWSFFGPSNKYEDAAEIYEKAGNMFKLAQQCKMTNKKGMRITHLIWLLLSGTQAGDAFTEAAKLYQRGSSAKFEGSRAYESAAKCYKRQDPSGKTNRHIRFVKDTEQACFSLRCGQSSKGSHCP